jgi:hypothetical protein
LVTFDSSELVLIKILYFGSNLLNVGFISIINSGGDRDRQCQTLLKATH